MADVTRAEFDLLAARVTALDGGPKPTPPPPPPPPPPATGVTVVKPTVKVSGTTYTLTSKVTALSSTTFQFLQLAVRGPGASDQAYNGGLVLAAGTSKTLTATVSSAQPGSFTAYAAYSLDGVKWVDGPKATFTILASPTDPVPPPPPPPPGDLGRQFPLVGKSKLPFNSTVFRWSAAEAETFGGNRGVPVDGLLYFTPRQSWDDLKVHAEDHRAYLESGHMIVMTVPHAPESEGSGMNDRGANNGYAAQQKDWAKWHVDNGFNSPLLSVRVDWECNGDWYQWSGHNPEALKASIRNFVTNARAAGLTKANYTMCFNKGPSQSGHDFDCFPGSDIISSVGVDQYDMWGPSYTQADWDGELNKSPSIKTNAEFAAQHGIFWSIDECGNTHPAGGSYGGDNPAYWRFMKASILKYSANCAWHNTYDEKGAPDTLMHDFARNPLSYTEYKRLWRP